MNDLRNRQSALLLIFLLNISMTTSGSASMGYHIIAKVDGTVWEIHRSTQSLDFISTGEVAGYGNFSKISHINGFAGIEAHEQSSSRNGNLNYDEDILLISREGPVIVMRDLMSYKNETIIENETYIDNETYIETQGRAKIVIDEKWKTRFANYKKVSFTGPYDKMLTTNSSIKLKERYINNGDTITTSINSWKLSKESFYNSKINRSIISVDITEDSLTEDSKSDKTSFYVMGVDTIGESMHFNVNKQSSTDNSVSGISQYYFGKYKINLAVEMSESILEPDTKNWLECCFGELYWSREIMNSSIHFDSLNNESEYLVRHH